MQTPAEMGMGEAQTRRDSDRELISRFLTARDESAFAQIVSRYSRLVMTVALHTLRDQHAAEDAFQATFLVLARSARRIRNRDSLASWLHGTAYRVAKRLQRTRLRRKEQDLPIVELPAPIWALPVPPDQQSALDEELARLGEGLRGPLVLHYLEGRTVPEIAQELKMSPACVEGRLKRGKQTLRKRLLKRGVLLSSALHGGSLLVSAEAQITTALVQATVAACLATAASTPLAPIAATTVTQLALQEMASMTRIALMKTALLWGGVAGVIGLAGAGANGTLGTAWAGTTGDPVTVEAPAELPISEEPTLPRILDTSVVQASADTSKQVINADGAIKTPSVKGHIEEEMAKSAELRFTGQTLDEILHYVAAAYKMPVVVDRTSLRLAGISLDTEVYAGVKGIPLEDGLKVVLGSVKDGPLDFRIEDDGLHIHAGRAIRIDVDTGLKKRVRFAFQNAPFSEIVALIENTINSRVRIDAVTLQASTRVTSVLSERPLGDALNTLLSEMPGGPFIFEAKDDGLHITSKATPAASKDATRLAIAPDGTAATTLELKQQNEEIAQLQKKLRQAQVALEQAREDSRRGSTKPEKTVGSGEAHGDTSGTQVLRQIHPANPREDRIRKALDETVNFQFTGQTLQEVTMFLETLFSMTVRLDLKSLQEAGVGADQEINLIIAGITLSEALNLMLEDVGGTALDYIIEDGVMKVTTKDHADSILQTVIYDTSVMGMNSEQVKTIVEETVETPSWMKNGGQGTVSSIENSVIVTTSRRVHEKTARFLDMLQRQSKSMNAPAL